MQFSTRKRAIFRTECDLTHQKCLKTVEKQRMIPSKNRNKNVQFIETVLNFGSDPAKISEIRTKVEKSSKKHRRNFKAP